jgi:hypothetical protein
MAKYVVRLSDESWLAPWKGDPGRTSVLHNARIYETEHGARTALGIARRWYSKRDFSCTRVEVWRRCECISCMGDVRLKDVT